ncbi:fatty acid desaturase [Amylibacter kogurei]|uniref:Fatty acid desaturase n=1 Tax=Paramylibacter kogurei TaxID=1889778 RepID=A0A2G5K4Q6_9RHOB|nr:acyl-CoA desaturase [Amylibacter kogurei]PIB24516.1 fatty acid desaturase [Amylibacter kogurei]
MRERTPQELVASERVFPAENTNAVDGVIRISPAKTLWIFGHGLVGIAGIFIYPQVGAFLVFLLLSAVTICAGHSVGMHRLLIHRSFATPRWVEYILVWLGVLVGMAGPFGMIRLHDLRDWHQRQTHCPPHPSHDAVFWRDAWWQLCCYFDLRNPPEIIIENNVLKDRFYRFLERTWMVQQVPLAILLYLFGGWAWVCWGISLRIFISLTGHWMVGHYAHKQGEQGWRIDGVAVQGYNLPRLGLITFGENWHGNHHAFPHSAKLGLEQGQIDPGFWLISVLHFLGLASKVKTPDSEPPRAGLQPCEGSKQMHQTLWHSN